jgi:hypothetical protein
MLGWSEQFGMLDLFRHHYFLSSALAEIRKCSLKNSSSQFKVQCRQVYNLLTQNSKLPRFHCFRSCITDHNPFMSLKKVCDVGGRIA